MTPAEMAIDKVAEKVDYKGNIPKGLHVTHEGVLEIGEIKLKCFILSDRRRIFDAKDVKKYFGSF
jgi:hypothetical protein